MGKRNTLEIHACAWEFVLRSWHSLEFWDVIDLDITLQFYSLYSIFLLSVTHSIAQVNIFINFFQWRPIVLPDNYIEHASPAEQLTLAGLTGHHIAATALCLLGRTREALLLMC